jgi:hypothetical protein
MQAVTTIGLDIAKSVTESQEVSGRKGRPAALKSLYTYLIHLSVDVPSKLVGSPMVLAW